MRKMRMTIANWQRSQQHSQQELELLGSLSHARKVHKDLEVQNLRTGTSSRAPIMHTRYIAHEYLREGATGRPYLHYQKGSARRPSRRLWRNQRMG